MSSTQMSPTPQTLDSVSPAATPTQQSGAVVGLVAGLAGGFAAWLIVEHTGWFSEVLSGSASLAAGTHRLRVQIALGAVYGLCVGGAISAARLTQPVKSYRSLVTVLLSMATGLLGGGVGIWLGQLLYDRLLSLSTAQDIITLGLVARCAGWGLIGLFLGAAQGVSRGSARGMGLGALGGLCGGVAGGAVFEALELIAANPPLARLVGFVFVGAATGFFLEAVPMLAARQTELIDQSEFERSMNISKFFSQSRGKQSVASSAAVATPPQPRARPLSAAQLICVQGAYAGMVFPLLSSKSHLTVGRLSDCDVCLMNDKGVSRRHALIRRDPKTGEYRLEDLRSQNGTCINHKRLKPNQAQTLYLGDVLDFGASSLRFEWIGAPPAHYS